MTGTLTIEQAYRAMHHFVTGYWERGGKRGRELTLFLSYSAPAQWAPADDNQLGTGDPAAWNDWLDAVQAVLS